MSHTKNTKPSSPAGSAAPSTLRGHSATASRSMNLPEMVYRTIRQHISQGHLAPGDRMTEVAIAEALGVSRTPVRESFLALAREGLLVKEGRSFMLPPLTLEDINDIGEVRQLLEPAAIRHAVARMSAATLAELEQALLQQKNAHAEDDLEAFIAANGRFRTTLLATVPNRRLRRAIELYGEHMHILRIRLRLPHWRELVLKNLSQLMHALATGDADAAAQIWRNTIADAEATAREWLREIDEASTLPLLPVRHKDRG